MSLLFVVLYIVWFQRCVFTFFFQAEDGIRDYDVTGVQTCALPICTIEPVLFNAMKLGDELKNLRSGLHNRRFRFLTLMARDMGMLIAGGLPLYRKVVGDWILYYGNLRAQIGRAHV